MSRQTRKAAASAAKVVESEDESDSDTENDKSKPKRREKRVDSQRFRMNADEDESFVKICVDYFDKINSTTTLKGTFTTKKNVDNNKAWEDITKQCNNDLEVSTVYMFFHE